MNRTVRAATAALVLFAAQAALAQPGGPPAPDPAGLRGDSVQTRKRLAEAEQKIVGGKAADAADDIQRLLDESADDLVTLDGRQYRAARWVAHALLAKLSPDALKAYQDRIDRPAKALLDQARRDRDPRPLRQLLDRYFVSRPAGEALLLLGDLLFERGEFRAAESEWRRLLPDAGADVTYPGARADAAPVRARVALAVIFQNDAARAAEEVAAFRAKHPTAAGTLAGKTGPFVDTLGAFLAAPPKLPPDATGGTAWPTYGGGPDRAGRVPGGIPNSFLPQPTWRAIIPPYQRDNRGAPGAQRPPVRPPYGHPVVAGNEVYVADGVRVLGFDLRSGEKTRESPQLVNVPPGPDPACTLTAAGGLLYARCGPAAVRAPEMTATGKLAAESFLVCLEPRPGERLVELWRVPPPEGDRLAATWEGAPLVSEGRLWAVYAKFEGGRTVHVAVCYDPADPDRAPDRPAWTAELCDSPLPVTGGDRTRQELLTLAGRHLVFCSNGGAVVAVDAVTGKRAWAFRYARSRRAVNGATGDPAPAVAFAGKVFVAPADGERVYALDAETGRVLWESGPTEGARILGVVRGRLVVSVKGPLRGIRGLALSTGSYLSDGGWIEGAIDAPLTYGQGLVTDDMIVWPTRSGLWFLGADNDPSSRKQLTEPLPAQARGYTGNVAYADGVLVVVTPTEVRGYVAESKKIVPRPDAPPPVKFDALVGRAEDELAAGNPAGASARFGDIAASDLPAPYRAWAAARMLQLASPAGDATRLPPGVRAALQPALLSEWILPPGGVPVTLGEFLQQKLGRSPAAASIPGAAAEDTRCAPALNADAAVDRELKFPPAVSPLRFIEGASPPRRLFAAGPRVVVAVPLDGAAGSEHIPADLFTHAADLRDGFVAAGPFAVAVYGAARDPLWVFRVPVTDRLPTGPVFRFRCGHEPAPPHLSSFALAGPWLLARIGDGHFVALDLAARRVAWVLGASGRAGYEPEPFPGTARFGEHFAVCGKFAVVQLSDGRRWFVKLDTGRPVTMPALGDRTARAWWANAPAVSGPDRLVLADGSGMVRLVQLGGRVKWVYETDRDEGLTGEPAQARAWGVLAGEENAARVLPLVLVAVRRNSGVEIDRVDSSDGKRVWTDEPAFADADRIDLFAADADADHVYIPAGNKLLAFTLNHGKGAWEADLPGCGGRGWVVRAGKTCVIAYPAEALPAEPPAAVWERLVRSFRAAPFAWRLPGLATSLYDAWVDRTVPVLLFDPETGKQLARVDVPARGPAVTAWFDAGTAVVATGDRVVWLK